MARKKKSSSNRKNEEKTVKKTSSVKKNKSQFGRISSDKVWKPKSRKGTRPYKPRKTHPYQQPCNGKKRPIFQLRLPRETNVPNPKVPWLRHDDDKKEPTKGDAHESLAVPNSDTRRKHLPSGLFQEHALQRLDDELVSFASYVRLDPIEQQAREYVIQHVADTARQLANRNKFFPGKKKNDTKGGDDAVFVQAFGSHATPEVCCFASDVDLALWGVVSPSESTGMHDKEDEHNKLAPFEQSESEKKPLHLKTDPNLRTDPVATKNTGEANKRAARVQKWRSALAEHDEVTGTVDTTATTETNGVAALLPPATTNDGEEQVMQQGIDRVVTDDAAAATTSNNTGDVAAKLNTHSDAAAPDVQQPPVMDNALTGEASRSNTGGEKAMDGVLGMSASTAITIDDPSDDAAECLPNHSGPSGVSIGQGTADSAQHAGTLRDQPENRTSSSPTSDPEILSETQESTSVAKLPPSTSLQPAQPPENGSSLQAAVDLCSDDSDNDSADKMQSFSRRQRKRTLSDLHSTNEDDDSRWKALVAAQQKRQRTVSLSSSTTNSDNEDEDNAKNESSDMTVSFVSNKLQSEFHPLQKPMVAGPSGITRAKVVRALKSLGKEMRSSSVTKAVEVRRNARVPIVSMTTHLGFETDVAIGGHNGADTSHYASMQTQKFKSFACVVLFLKILLIQQDLDKPFSGGLGSYKLYVLVAHHLEQHLALGGTDRPSEILLSFFFRYGGIESSVPDMHTGATTRLSNNVVLSSNGGSAEFKPVFKLDHCTQLFSICWERLLLTCSRNGGSTVLWVLIDSKQLTRDRKSCRNQAAQWQNRSAKKGPVVKTMRKVKSGSKRKGGHVNDLCSGHDDGRHRRKRRLEDESGDVPSWSSDDEREARRLMVGYGVLQYEDTGYESRLSSTDSTKPKKRRSLRNVERRSLRSKQKKPNRA